MNRTNELAGIDLVWWPTLLRCQYNVEQREQERFTSCLNQLALALASEEE